jgi:threonine synthase
VAGLLVDHEQGRSVAGRTVVVTVTGHGLKDIDTALSTFSDVVDVVIEADVEQAAAAAGLR